MTPDNNAGSPRGPQWPPEGLEGPPRGSHERQGPSITGAERIRQIAAHAMTPVRIERPVINPELLRRGPVERAGEVLRYSFFRAEFWLSPGGTLREWLRFNLKLALLLGIPAVLLTPIITLLLTTAVEWSGKMVEIARNLVLIPAWLGGAVLIISGIAFLRRFIFGR